MIQNIQVKCEIFREDDLYVGICPELNVSSFGETIEEARKSLQEALVAFLEECEEMNTLEIVLQEAGFIKGKNAWLPRQPIRLLQKFIKHLYYLTSAYLHYQT